MKSYESPEMLRVDFTESILSDASNNQRDGDDLGDFGNLLSMNSGL